MAKVLLINPSYMGSYGNNKMSIVSPIFPTLSLATIAASVRENGHNVKIMDMSYLPYDYELLRQEVISFLPDIIGITALTPMMNQLRDMSVLLKELSNNILLVGGGPHVSALPEETMNETLLDVLVIGEGDITFREICDGVPLSEISGIYWRDDGQTRSTGMRTPIADLDSLPFPAWDLYDAELYTKKISRLLVKRPPVATIEFSRGCVFKCDYCASKITMALGYRKKSPERCAQEVTLLKSLGFNEFMVADDIFTSDEHWALVVTEAIIDSNVDMSWTCTNGIRVESCNGDLFEAMQRAGCYRVSFGFESGNDEVLKRFGKGGRASIEKGSEAVQTARRNGIETNGFFMIGLSCDNERTMTDTIQYARRLPLDMLKFSVTIAFPGTSMFNNYSRKGLIKSYNWDDYHIYSDAQLFSHERLTFDAIQRYMKKAYRHAIILNPKFIFRRFLRGLRTYEFFFDVFYFFRFIFAKTTSGADQKYYAKARWPNHDFLALPPAPSQYQTVRKTKTSRASS